MAVRFHIDALTYTVVGEIRPEQLFQVGHEVFNFFNGIRRELQVATKAAAPPHISKKNPKYKGRPTTGDLERNITARMKRVGPEEIDLILDSAMAYTMFVHGGTAFKRGGNFIYSTAGKANQGTVNALIEGGFKPGTPGQTIPENLRPLFMALPPFAGYAKLQLRVKGQSANPFLYRGFNVVALRHECLGGQFTGVVGLGSLT